MRHHAGMKNFKFIFYLCVVISWPFTVQAYDWHKDGERLQYDVRFWGLHAGDAELVFRPLEDDQYSIVGRAWSGDFSSLVNIQDRWSVFGHGYESGEMLSDRYTVRLFENDYRAHKETRFYPDENKATYHNIHAGHKPLELALAKGARDTASALYHLRYKVKEINVGDEYVLPVLNLDSPYTMRLRVLSRKVIDTAFGDRATFHMVPVYEDANGNEKQSRWNFWVADDGSHLPLRIKVKLNFGSFEANLLKYGSLDLPSVAPKYLPETGDFEQKKKKYSYANPIPE